MSFSLVISYLSEMWLVCSIAISTLQEEKTLDMQSTSSCHLDKANAHPWHTLDGAWLEQGKVSHVSICIYMYIEWPWLKLYLQVCIVRETEFPLQLHSRGASKVRNLAFLIVENEALMIFKSSSVQSDLLYRLMCIPAPSCLHMHLCKLMLWLTSISVCGLVLYSLSNFQDS